MVATKQTYTVILYEFSEHRPFQNSEFRQTEEQSTELASFHISFFSATLCHENNVLSLEGSIMKK